MDGPNIIVQTLSQTDNVTDSRGNKWQYFSRSDRHSKTVCWAFLFDLLHHCRLLREHAVEGAVGFGINHQMRDFKQDKKKDLDLVVCRAAPQPGVSTKSFADFATDFKICLTEVQREKLRQLPRLEKAPVSNVFLALEAKAAMTSHVKACPRLYDELNSSHSIVHGDSQVAIAAGLVLVNFANEFVSPDSNKVDLAIQPPTISYHRQPRATERTIETILKLPRRHDSNQSGFDGISALIIDCKNDGSPVRLVTEPPAPRKDDTLHYDSLVHRVAHLYRSRFPQI